MISIVNGAVTNNIAVTDRGLAYGDGLFETMLSVSKVIPFWDYHMDRLNASCERLHIPVPDTIQLRQQIDNHLVLDRQQIIKIIITRGPTARGYACSPQQSNTVVLINDRQFQSPAYWQKGVQVRRCITNLARQPLLAGMKHLNRLEQVLARDEWHDSDIQEGLMCMEDESVIEATSHNLFCVKNNALYTPDLSACGVEGIMRRYVIELAGQMDVRVYSETILYEELADMDELFLTNSVSGIWPIHRLESTEYKIGPVTRQFQQTISRLLPYQ